MQKETRERETSLRIKDMFFDVVDKLYIKKNQKKSSIR
jgi:hypothetical protein